MPHEDGIVLGTQFVTEHLRERCGECKWFEVLVDKPVERLCPFQDDIRAMLLIECHKAAIQFSTFILKYTHSNLNTRIAQFPYSTSRYLGKGVNTSHDNPLHTLAHYKVGTRRCLAIVRTRFKTHVNGALRQQMFVRLPNRGKGVHLRMTFAASHVISLTDDTSVAHNHCAHHRIRSGVLPTVGCYLQTTAHINLVNILSHIKLVHLFSHHCKITVFF